jgi:hypothetical protein
MHLIKEKTTNNNVALVLIIAFTGHAEGICTTIPNITCSDPVIYVFQLYIWYLQTFNIINLLSHFI